MQWRQAVTECGDRVLWCIPCGSQLRRHWPAQSHHLWLRLCRREVADGASSHRLPKRRRAWSQPWAAVTVRRAAVLPSCGRLPPGSCTPRRLHHALPAPAPRSRHTPRRTTPPRLPSPLNASSAVHRVHRPATSLTHHRRAFSSSSGTLPGHIPDPLPVPTQWLPGTLTAAPVTHYYGVYDHDANNVVTHNPAQLIDFWSSAASHLQSSAGILHCHHRHGFSFGTSCRSASTI